MMIHPNWLLNVTSRQQKSNLVALQPRTCAQNLLTTCIPIYTDQSIKFALRQFQIAGKESRPLFLITVLRNTIRVSNSLDPDQDQHSDLDPNFAKFISRRQKSQLATTELLVFPIML